MGGNTEILTPESIRSFFGVFASVTNTQRVGRATEDSGTSTVSVSFPRGHGKYTVLGSFVLWC